MSSTLNRIGIFSVVSKIYTTKINFVGVLDTIFFFFSLIHFFTYTNKMFFYYFKIHDR